MPMLASTSGKRTDCSAISKIFLATATGALLHAPGTPQKISRKKLLSKFLDEFETLIGNTDLDNVITEWKRYTVTLNRHVRVVTSTDVSEGFAIDVDENGALELQLVDGSYKRVVYGDCFHN